MTLATTQQEHYHSLLPRPHNDGFHAFARDILQNMVNDHHATFLMEYCDRPNILIRLLVSLHELGGNCLHQYYLLSCEKLSFLLLSERKPNSEYI